MPLNSSKFLLLLATPLILVSPATSAVENVSPIANPPVLAQTTEERLAEADRLLQQGIEQYQTSQFQAAIQSWEQALAIYREIGNVAGEAKSLNGLGGIDFQQGQYEQAIQSWEQALAIYRNIGDLTGEANSLMNLGWVYLSLGEYERAISFSDRSLAIFREIGNVAGEAKSLNNLGGIYFRQGQYEQAIEFYQQSLAIFREIGDVASEAKSFNNLGLIYESLGQYDQAIEFYQQSLVSFQGLGDVASQATSFHNLAGAYLQLGQYDQAIECFQKSLAITRDIGDVASETTSILGLGGIYFLLGQYEQALEFYQQSLTIAQEIGYVIAEANSFVGLGIVYDSLGEYESAIELYQQSLAIFREIGDVAGEANSLNNLGTAYHSLGKYESAIECFQQSLVIKRDLDDVSGEATSLNNLGNSYFFLGQYERAIELYQQSLPIFQEIGDVAGEADSLNNLGATFLETGNFAAAEQHLFAAIEAYETLRADLTSDEDKISIFEIQTRSYRLLQRALIAQNKIETALEISERGRARAFVELMAQRLHGGASEEFTPPAPPTLADIQQVARTQNATLVEYSVISSKSLYIWVIQPTGDIAFRQVDLDSLDTPLAQLVTQSRATIGVRSPAIIAQYLSSEELAARQTDRLQQLHQLLIEPIADLLPTNPESPVVFVPHQSLFLVPFPALLNADGEYLIDHHTILTAPSIQVLELTQRVGANGRSPLRDILIVGNPTMPLVGNPGEEAQPLSSLPGAETEAVAIANLFNTQPLLANEATESTVTQQMPAARIIHLATHGLFDYGIPEEMAVRDLPGAIALTPGNGEDGLLTSAELLELNLNAELVVLSACDTGRGDITGDGVVGLSRSLVTAGVESVVVSLWAVPDAPTAELMTAFYNNLQQGLDKATALRNAMLSTRSTHPEPRDWAAFTLIGNR